jgi:hypothetical protein
VTTTTAACAVRSWLVNNDQPVPGSRVDHDTVDWDEFRNIMTIASAVQVTVDLWDAPQPDGTIRRYRAINAEQVAS